MTPEILPQHAALITRSAISDEVALARGYRSVNTRSELRSLGFSNTQIRVPALLIPIHSVTGEVVLYQIRPDVPRIKDGKALKYETPLKAHMVLDVPPPAHAGLGDPSVPLFVTEGARKADSAVSRGLCCVALLGVWSWRGTNDEGGKVALPDWDYVALNGRQVYIVFDSDVMLKPSVQGALARLKAFLETRKAKLAAVYLPAGQGGVKVGLDDYFAACHGVDDLLALASPTLRPAAPDEMNGPQGRKGTALGRPIELEDPEPWEEPVDGAVLLNETATVYSRYLVLPRGGAEVAALWTAHTYSMNSWEHTGYLSFCSPTKGCGKTSALTVATALARRALSGGNVSPASVFRVIQKAQPTIMIDELDRVPRESDLWNVVNTGHARSGAVIRTVGDDHEPRAFSTWCAKALAYIRPAKSPVPDTTESRCIRVMLQRKRRNEPREKLRTRALEAVAATLRRQLMRWAEDNAEALGSARPEVPEELDDRAADCWEALLAVADVASGQWPELARRLAVQYSAERAEEEREDVGVLLLADLGEMIERGKLLPDQGGFASEVMVELLHELADRPWRAWGKAEKPISEHALARLLRPFGLRTERFGPESERVRRYAEGKLRDAIDRSAWAPPAAKRTSGQPPEEDTVSASSEKAVRMDASDADREGVRTDVKRTSAPDAQTLSAAHESVYRHRGQDYRPGDTLPDGRLLESIEHGIPVLLRPRRRDALEEVRV